MADEPKVAAPVYQFFMLTLCIYALAVLAVQRIAHLEPSTQGVLDYVDYIVCVFFLLDFFISLWKAPNNRYPVTGEGRFIAGILMAAGVGLFGTFSGFLAAWFLGSAEGQEANADLVQLRDEVASLRRAFEAAIPHLKVDSPADIGIPE